MVDIRLGATADDPAINPAAGDIEEGNKIRPKTTPDTTSPSLSKSDESIPPDNEAALPVFSDEELGQRITAKDTLRSFARETRQLGALPVAADSEMMSDPNAVIHHSEGQSTGDYQTAQAQAIPESDYDYSTIVEAEAELVSDDKRPKDRRLLYVSCTVITAVLIVVIAVAVTVGVVLTHDDGSVESSSIPSPVDVPTSPPEPSDSPSTATPLPTSTPRPTGLPTTSPTTEPSTQPPSLEPSPGTLKAFETTNELYTAVNSYLLDNGTDTEVARMYGWPIVAWNVSAIRSFTRLFDALSRNGNAGRFNENLSNWDTSSATDLSHMFQGAYEFNNDIADWDLSSVTSTFAMFSAAGTFNQNISRWDTSAVTDMGYMFSTASAFNQDISTWDLASVTSTRQMFDRAYSFRQDVCAWGPTMQLNRPNAIFMFRETNCPNPADPNLFRTPPGPLCFTCTSAPVTPVSTSTTPPTGLPTSPPTTEPSTQLPFLEPLKAFETTNELYTAVNSYLLDNGTDTEVARMYGWPIVAWNVSAIRNFSRLFDALSRNGNADRFNENLSRWDTSSATDLSHMFQGAYQFNNDIADWDLSSVTSTFAMFSGAGLFNQNISPWNTSAVTDMGYMFSTAFVFNQDISRWNMASVTSTRQMFDRAYSFQQDVCAWGPMMQLNRPNTAFMFRDTNCVNPADPNLLQTPPGPLCFTCT